MNKDNIGYMLSITKQTSMTGEQITINTNLEYGATQNELADEIKKITGALQSRTDVVNNVVLAHTAENLRKQGIPEKEIVRLLGEQVPFVD